MASATWSGLNWSAVGEESTCTGTTSGRSSSCSAGISRRDGNRSAASRGRADLDMNWRSSCSKQAGNSGQDRSLNKASILGRDKVEAQASGSRQSEVGWSRQQGAARNVVQAEDRRLDRDSCGFPSVKREAGLLPNEGDDQMDVLCPVSRPSSLIRGASPNSQPENQSLGASVKPVPSSRTFHPADPRKAGVRVAGVGPVPAPRFSRIAERLPLRRPNSPPPTLRPGPAVERKAGENTSNAERPTPAAAKSVAPVPLAPALHLASPSQARGGGDTWQWEKPWPPQGPGPVSSLRWEAASFQPGGGSMLPPPASSVQTAPRDANTRSGMRAAEWPTLPPKPAAAETPKASDWNRPLGTGLPGLAHHIRAAETNEEGGPSSFEIRSSRHGGPACPGIAAEGVTNELREKVNLSVSQSVTGDVPWQYKLWWLYKDNEGYVQGPFKSDQMLEWFLRGLLPMDMMLKRICDGSFRDLGSLIKISKGLPFAADICVSIPPQP